MGVGVDLRGLLTVVRRDVFLKRNIAKTFAQLMRLDLRGY